MIEPQTLPGMAPPPSKPKARVAAPGAPRFYVDPLMAWGGPNAGKTEQARRLSRKYGGKWCHLMIERDGDLEELHRFAARLGMRRAWFQPHPEYPHYDLVPPRRAVAVRLGAVEVDGDQQVQLCHRRPGSAAAS